MTSQMVEVGLSTETCVALCVSTMDHHEIID